MAEYRSNSHKSRETEQVPEKKVTKVVSGSVQTKKKSMAQKAMSLLLPDDVTNPGGYFLQEYVMPYVGDMILDTLGSLFGRGRRNNSSREVPATRVNYRQAFNGGNRSQVNNNNIQAQARNAYDYDDIILNNRGDAESVLTRMDELMATYGIVSVADYYDLCGMTTDYTANKYGWTSIRNAYVERVNGGGYTIKLPRAMALD